MRAVDLIRKKRDGGTLSTPPRSRWMVEGIARGEVADYQWSALLMAIVWRGMSAAETAALTDAMMRFRLGRRPLRDPGPEDRQAQHRRRGRQDLADPRPDRRRVRRAGADGLGPRAGPHRRHARQARVDPRIPGRSRPGTNTGRCSRRCGLVLIGQTAEIAPADKTAVRPARRDGDRRIDPADLRRRSCRRSWPRGSTAWSSTSRRATARSCERSRTMRDGSPRRCARSAGTLGKTSRRPDHADGSAAGPRRGQRRRGRRVHRMPARAAGPADLMELSVELAAEMVVLGGQAATLDEARARCRQVDRATARRLTRFRRVVEAQGGDPRFSTTRALLPRRSSGSRSRRPCRRACMPLDGPADRPCDDAARARADARIDSRSTRPSA